MTGKWNNLRINFIKPQTQEVVAEVLELLATQFRELGEVEV